MIPFAVFALFYFSRSVEGFLIVNPRTKADTAFRATNGESHSGGDLPKDETNNLLAQPSSRSRLSHVMLQVPSVDETVDYWKETANGQVTTSSQLDEDELRSAFLVLGNGKTTEECFALELVKNKHKKFELGNAVSYLGVSKLVQYASKEDLIGLITGMAPKQDDRVEPNGIPVQSCASAPGDFFCRFCLHASNLDATSQFYTDILGMSVAAVDEKMLCLRYKDEEGDGNDKTTDKSFYGVPTTLVFELLKDEELQQGNCFDHLVIATKANIEDVYTQLQQALGKSDLNCPLFMKPTEMFGQKVCGVMDPSGYKIILAGKA